MKTVLITGASRGIGAATARLFAANGYAVAVNYCRAKQAADELVQTIQKQGGEAFAVYGDVSVPDEAKSVVQAVYDRYGHLDVLIHNAGIAQQKLLTDVTDEEWHRMLGVHVDGAFYCTRAAAPDMIKRQAGRIITVSSMWGVRGASCEVPYSTAKAALIGFTKALAKELGPSHITVNCVAPGVIATDMCADFDASTMQELSDSTSLGRLGTAEDVAKALLFLASDDASFITGQILGVDGGFIG